MSLKKGPVPLEVSFAISLAAAAASGYADF
jgi:hypothetical protein